MAAQAIANPFEDAQPAQQPAPAQHPSAIDNPFEDTTPPPAPQSQSTSPSDWWTSVPIDAGKAIGSDLFGMVKSIPSLVKSAITPGPSDVRQQLEMDAQNRAADQARQQAGYGPVYRAVAPVAHQLGVNVPAMEQDAAQGKAGAVIGHAVAPAVAGALVHGAVTEAPAIVEGAGDLLGSAAKNISKTAVTRGLQADIGASLDTVAQNAGVDTSGVPSLRAKTGAISSALKTQAQQDYQALDQASGGRYQRYVDEIDELQDALRNKYTTPDAAKAIKQQLSQVQNEYAGVQQQLIQQGVDPNIISRADAKWAQARALDDLGKKFKIAENLEGNLKPGTPSVDTGLKNLRPHILKQATGDAGIAGDITDATTSATAQAAKVARNQNLMKVLGLGSGAGALYEILAGGKSK